MAHESCARSSSASPTSSARRIWASWHSSDESHLVLLGFLYFSIKSFCNNNWHTRSGSAHLHSWFSVGDVYPQKLPVLYIHWHEAEDHCYGTLGKSCSSPLIEQQMCLLPQWWKAFGHGYWVERQSDSCTYHLQPLIPRFPSIVERIPAAMSYARYQFH